MKKITFLLALVFCLTAADIYGKQISIDEAQSLALNHMFRNYNPSLHGTNPATQQLELVLAAKSKSQDVDYYVFNKGKCNGYIIVSGDDKAAPILGFSDEGTFDFNNIPDGLQYWLEVYSQEMQYLRSNPNAPAASIRQKRSSSVRPLLTCNWAQVEPYNNLCPTYTEDGITEHAVTGCVATAAAQIMYYHRWPITGTGSHSYVCDVNYSGEQTLSADFGSTTYDWDNMLDSYDGSYTDTQANAVATLMSHVGIACDMFYSSRGSGSRSYYPMMEGLRNYFGYNKGMIDMMRANTPINEWEQTIINELDNSRPVLYGGFKPGSSGHAFVLDGYNDEGYFHVNWGVGGRNNGYFLITALSLSDQAGTFGGGFNTEQEIIIGIYPDDGSTAEPENYIEFGCEEYKSSVPQVNLGESAQIILNGFFINGYGYYPTVFLKYGLNLTDLNNNTVDFKPGEYSDMDLWFGCYYNFLEDYTPPTNLPDGQYRLWLMCMVPEAGMTEYVPCEHFNTTTGYINVTVQDGIVYFDGPETNDGILSLESLEVPSKVGTNSNFEVKATIANAGDEYYDNIYFVVKQQETIISTGDAIKIDVPTDGNVIVRSFVAAPAESGTYQLAVYDKKKQMIGSPVTLNVAESSNYSLSISSQLSTPGYYMDPSDIQASAVISNSGTGDFIGNIEMWIVDKNVSWLKKSVYSPTITIPAGQSATVHFKCEFYGSEGMVYKMFLIKPDNDNWWGNKVAFEIKSYSTAVEDFEQMAATTAPPNNDVQGNLSTWEFDNCFVTSPGSDYCSGEHSAVMKKTALLTMTEDVHYVSRKISFDAYNPSTSAADFVLYCSTDQGTTWTALANSSGETTTTVAAGSNATLNFPCNIKVPSRYRISITEGATTHMTYIDNFTIYYYDVASFATIEDFEDMTVATTPPAVDVQGKLSTWKFANCYVTAPGSNHCSGEHSTVMKKPASLTMTEDVRYVSKEISFDAYNAATSVAKFVLYRSTDQGASWTAVANSNGETTSSVGANSNVTLTFPSYTDVPARYRINMTAGATSYKAYIDNFTIYYTDELPPEMIPGDVDGDGVVTAADVTMLYNILLNDDYNDVVNADQDGDGYITSADVTAVYNILLGE
ncbi:MAG: C10 family peptidase [Muribaculaceae bacterium]|nr:C10 family peptidase [Muribaculaceae bacterium]